MPRLAFGQLSHVRGKGFRASVGYYDKGGKRTPKVFWLGHDPVIAHYYADQARGAWSAITSTGGQVWPEHEVRSLKAAVAHFAEARDAIFAKHEQARQQLAREGEYLNWMFGSPHPAAHATAVMSSDGNPAASTTAKAAPTLYGAIEAYLESFKGKRKSDSHKLRADAVLNVNLKKARPDCPLADIDFLWIDRLCDHFKARPASLKDGSPIAPHTVKVILQYLRQFFTWIDDTGFGGWEGPRKLLKPFRVRIDDLMTPAELRKVGTIEQFDVETLTKLHAAASDRQRAIMLTGLFTGGTQQELAVMEQSEFDLNAATLTHFRNKTKVKGIYWLPPQLVKLLRRDFKSRPSDPLAFRTSDGNPLVTFRDGKKISDAVHQTWDDLRKAAGLPDALPFKYLRKFLADWMTRNGGEEMGMIAMSHSRQTVLARNYTTARQYDRFHRLQKRMHAELTKQGMFGSAMPTRRTKQPGACAA